MSTAQAGEMLPASEPTIRKYLQEGKLRGYRVGKLYKVSVESIKDYRREHAVIPNPPPSPPRRPRRRFRAMRPGLCT
ncbi:helix-turn-helix domain-containing protein [Phytomonospora endophytica]|uniref:Excisionase family DNA binding protein n=1 Tax=Phytomonospora endophytica TaxID=714109 RepID=A0A841FQJ3_9ACTN|nr:helix-turn-helix domain-containing protein [Phytomonospora endophytica]MBB6038346.1 excisionase family DNA binding protein [Phytomonospora endophytica]GIG64276.1 hypothetical protein Pen01_05710 [Phytomonospora endophytica]